LGIGKSAVKPIEAMGKAEKEQCESDSDFSDGEKNTCGREAVLMDMETKRETVIQKNRKRLEFMQ